MGLTFLSSPYSSPNSMTRRWRYIQACRAAAALMRQGETVFAPISHSHPIASIGGLDPNDGLFWSLQDRPYMALATKLVVLMLPGWEESKGVQSEIQQAKAKGIPVRYVEPDTVN